MPSVRERDAGVMFEKGVKGVLGSANFKVICMYCDKVLRELVIKLWKIDFYLVDWVLTDLSCFVLNNIKIDLFILVSSE